MTDFDQLPAPDGRAEFRAYWAARTARCCCCDHVADLYGEADHWRNAALDGLRTTQATFAALQAERADHACSRRMLDEALTLIDDLTGQLGQ